MDRRTVLLAACAVLAGCGAVPFGAGAPATPSETLTPVPVSPATDRSPNSTPVDRPPGVPVGGPVNAVRLRSAHEAYLADRSYTWVLDYDVRRPPNAESAFDQGFRRRALVEGNRFFVEQVDGDEPLNQSLFVDDSGGYLRVVERNVTRTDTLLDPGTDEDYVVSGQVIERFLDGMNPSVTRVTRGGETYYRLHDGTGLPPALQRLAIANYSVTAYVTPEGFVRSMAVSYDRVWAHSVETVSIRFDYSAVGTTTVDAPDWVAGLSVATPTPTPPSPVTSTSTLQSPPDTPTVSPGTTTAPTEATATVTTGTTAAPAPTATPSNATGS